MQQNNINTWNPRQPYGSWTIWTLSFFLLERFQGQEDSEYQENLSLDHFSRVPYFIFADK